MKTVKQLKEERGVKEAALKRLLDTATAEKRELTDEESTQFDTLEREVEDLDGQIERAEKVEKTQLRMAARAAGTPVQGDISEKEERDLSKYSLRKALLSLTDKNTQLDGVEREMHQEAEKESRLIAGHRSSGGLMIPEIMLDRMYQKRALDPSTGNGANLYGEVASGYVEALRPESVALQLGANFMTGMTNDFKVPRENAVFAPTFKASQDAATVSNPTMAKASFAPKRVSGYMDVDRQLLVQTANSVEQRMRNQLLRGTAQLLDRVAFTGDSAADEPVGILNDAGVGILAIGANGGAITKVLIETLVQQLEEANGMNDNTKWVTSPILKRLLKALTLDSGSGQFVWDRLTNTIDGIGAVATTHIPKNIAKGTGTNLTAAVLGDFRSAEYAQWGGMEIIVDNITQALVGNIRYIPIQWVDFNVTQPGHFQVIKDITTS